MWRIAIFSVLLAAPALAEPIPSQPRLIRVKKAERTLEYLENGQVVRTFRVALGGAPQGDKEEQGDQKTPEGTFFVAWKNPNSSFHRFLGLSYPMVPHAERALERGLIRPELLKKVRDAVRKKQSPPQTTAMGGYVGIHGGGGFLGQYDWTLGCVAIADEEIEWLFQRVKQGDPVEVLP